MVGTIISGAHTSSITLTSTSSNPVSVTGTISVTNGVALTGIGGDSWTIGNSGTILATAGQGKGIELGSFTTNVTNAVVTNESGGVISASGTLGYGVFVYGPGSVTNLSGGTISAGHIAVEFNSNTGTIVNSGVMLASSNVAAYEREGGIITNLAGGTISGSTGVWFQYGAGTFTNAGTVIGTSSQDGAVLFNDQTSSNLLIADPGAVFEGAINGGRGELQLASASTAGSLNGFNGTSITNFGTLQFDAGAEWTVVGNSAASGLGTIAITGFTANDTIDLTGFVAVSKTFASNELVLTNAATAHATLHIQGATFTSSDFQLSSYNAGTGTQITFGTSSASTYNWTGGSADWETAGDWSSDIVPGTAASATITNAGSNTVTISSAETISVAGVTLGNGNTLQVAGSLIPSGTLEVYSGLVSVAGTGVISGNAAGVVLYGSGGAIINKGKINGTVGVTVAGTAASGHTIIDSGTIVGSGGTAVAFGGGNDLLQFTPGNVLVQGTVNGGGGSNTLAFTSTAGTGTLTGSGANFVNFQTATIDAGAQWTLAGTNTLASGITLTNSGTLTDSGTFSNAGLVTGAATGILLTTGAYLTNQSGGTIVGAGTFGVSASGAATVVNAGSIGGRGNLGYGISLHGGGSITNQASGTITGGYSGIYVANASGTISNAGHIIGTSGAAVVLSSGSVANLSGGIITGVAEGLQIGVDGFVTNASGGSITGLRGVYSETGPSTVVNAGYISGTGDAPADAGVFLSSGGTVSNASGGTIAGNYNGVYVSDGTVINAGSIAGTSASGVRLDSSGTVTNQSGGTITGDTSGVYASYGTVSNASGALISGGYAGVELKGIGVTLTNLGQIAATGAIAASYGVLLRDGGLVTNGQAGSGTSTASIQGYFGLAFKSLDSVNAQGTLLNYGTVIGTQAAAVKLSNGGTVFNGQSGATGALIEGVQYGVFEARGVVLNAGTIIATGGGGTGVAIQGTGSVSNLGSAVIEGFGGVLIATDGTVINAGTIESTQGTGGSAVFFTGGTNRLIDDPGAVFIGVIYGGTGGTAVLELASAASAGTIAGFGGSVTNFGSLVFDAGAQWTVAGNDSANGLGTLGIGGFTAGDTIDLTGFAAISKTFASNALVLGNGGGAHETLHIQGTFTTAEFNIGTDGNSGTDITFVPLVAPVIAGTAAGQATTDEATVQPFSAATITDANGSQSESVTITVTSADVATDADGTLSGTGLTKTGTGTYTLSAVSAAAVTTELQALVFTPTEHQVAPGETVTTGFTIQDTDLDGVMSASDSTTTVIVTAVNDPPTITLSSVAVGVPNEAGDTPFAAMTINDPDVGHTDTVTVTLSDPTGGTLSNLDGGSFDAGTGVYTVSGTAGAVTTALDGLAFTPTAPTSGYVRTTGFTVTVTGPGGSASNSSISVTAVQQVLGLSTVPGADDVISISPDGSSFPAPTPDETNQAVVTAPSPGSTYILPTGYQAEFLGGTAGATLDDPSSGDALLAGNSGSDQIFAGAGNDTILGGSGADTLAAFGDDDAVLGGSGGNLVFALGDGDSVTSSSSDTLVGGSGSTTFLLSSSASGGMVFGGSGGGTISDAGSHDTLTGGSGAVAVTTSGADALFLSGASAASVVAGGTGETLVGGSGQSTFRFTSSASGGLAFGGTGGGTISDAGSHDTLIGGSGAVAVTTSGADALFFGEAGNDSVVASGTGETLVGGSSQSTFQFTSSASGGLAFGGSGGGTISDAGSHDTLIGGSGAVAVTTSGADALFFSEAGNDSVVASGTGETLVGGSGQSTFQFTSSASGGLAFGGSGGGTISDAGSHDTLVGGSGPVAVTLAGSDALFFSEASAASVVASGTGDTIVAGSAATAVTSEGSGLVVYGGSGPLSFVGGAAGATIVGGSGNASIIGGSGGTTLFGGTGGVADYIGSTGGLTYEAGTGNETLDASGSTTNDMMFGGGDTAGGDSIVGGSGSDTLVAGAGSDTLAGGSGTNLFVALSGDGGAAANEFISGFNANDTLWLVGYSTGAAATALGNAVSAGGSTTITLSDSTQITFLGIASTGDLLGHVVS